MHGDYVRVAGRGRRRSRKGRQGRAEAAVSQMSALEPRITGTVLFAALLTTSVGAQQPSSSGAAVPQPAPATAAVQAASAHPGTPAEAAPSPAYSYSPEGRRDPFVSLIGRGSDARPAGSRPTGVPGLL